MAMRGGVPRRPASAVTTPRTMTAVPMARPRASAIEIVAAGLGVGLGEGLGVGVGVTLGVGLGVGTGLGEGLGGVDAPGVALGDGSGGALGGAGTATSP